MFSGQGAQRSGMGVELMADSLFSRIVEEASALSQLDLLQIMQNDHEELTKTEYVQPALVTVSYGIYRMLQRDLPELPVAGMVGLSLGEYAAMLASQMLDFNQGIKLITDRAKYMQSDAEKITSTLAAILDPNLEAIKQFVNEQQKQGKQIYIANFNSPRQIVLGGVSDDVHVAIKKIETDKLAKRAVNLEVNGAFHTPLFNEAREKMHRRLMNIKFNQPLVPVISNTTVQPFNVKDSAAILERQLAVPTHFGADIRYLVNHQQIDATIEIGPGKTLTRFAKQVEKGLTTFHISNLHDYEKFIEERQNGANK